MYKTPQVNDLINFNDYTIFPIEFTCNPSGNTFLNEPIQLTSTFNFVNLRAFDSNTSLQILIVPQSNIVYCRDYDFESGLFTAWRSTEGGSGTNYMGTYNAATNTVVSTGAHLQNGVGQNGDWYLTVVAGTNNPTGAMLASGQTLIYNGAIYEAGGTINTTDEMVVANSYEVLTGDIVAGELLTSTLGKLDGNTKTVNTAKINKVANSTAGDIPTLQADGTLNDSGVQLVTITNHIDELDNTTLQQGQAIGSLQNNVAQNTQDITSINQALPNKQNLVSGATNKVASFNSNGQVEDSGIPKANVTTQGNTFNGISQLIQTTPDGYIPPLYSGNTQALNPTTSTVTALNEALENIYMSIPANTMVNPMTSIGDLIVGGTPTEGVAPPTRLGIGSLNQVLTTVGGVPTWALNPGLYQYDKQRYVDPVNGVNNAAQSGAYGAPWKTVAYALTRITTGMIICLMGQSPEAAFSISLTNIDIVAFGTRSALNGFNNLVTITGTGAGSVRIQNLNMGGGLTRASGSTCGLYLYGGSIGAAGFNQLGNGYTEFVDCDASNGAVSVAAGTVNMFGGKSLAPTQTGTSTITFDNLGAIIGNGTVASGGTLNIFESNWVATSTGYAITSSGTAVVLMQGNNFVRPNGTLATISVTLYDYQDQDFDKINSILGTHVGNYDWYARIGLGNADTITGATKMLVRKPTGEIAEQTILSSVPVQFNAPVSSLYTPDLTPTPLALKSSAGSSQTTQMVQLCTVNGSITLDQVFCATIGVGKTLTYDGRLVVYNAATVTQPNYYIIVQLVGALAGSGQWVNLGDAISVTLSKTQYAYNQVSFSGSYTNPSGSAIEAIGIRAQLLYGEANITAIVDTLFIEGNVS